MGTHSKRLAKTLLMSTQSLAEAVLISTQNLAEAVLMNTHNMFLCRNKNKISIVLVVKVPYNLAGTMVLY